MFLYLSLRESWNGARHHRTHSRSHSEMNMHAFSCEPHTSFGDNGYGYVTKRSAIHDPCHDSTRFYHHPTLELEGWGGGGTLLYNGAWLSSTSTGPGGSATLLADVMGAPPFSVESTPISDLTIINGTRRHTPQKGSSPGLHAASFQSGQQLPDAMGEGETTSA